MQKSLLISLFFGIVLCSKVVDKPQYVSRSIHGVKTTRYDEILMSVETSLQKVEISEPKVSVILPGAFKTCADISILRLNLMKGPIRFLETSFKGFNNLTELYFGDSLVTLYSDSFAHMPNLMFIEMRLSKFTTELSNKFDTLQYLKELRIKNGNWEKIKANTFHINNNRMTLLELSSCSIFFIEANAFATLINLVRLDLSNNALMRIEPGTFDGLFNLRILNLTYNNLYRIRKTALNSLVQLVTLDVSYNDLIEIASTAFLNLKIQNFILNNNRLEIIEKGLFNYLNSSTIQEISLQNNLINDIGDGAFAGLDIMILNLTGNNLGFIGNKMFKGCIGIFQLDLSGNPITKFSENPFKNCKIETISFFIDDKKSLEELVSNSVSGSIEIKWRQ